MTVADRLAELGITLPGVAAPVAAYVPAVRLRQPRLHGRPAALRGRRTAGHRQVGDTVDADTAAAQRGFAALNALAAVASVAGSLDRSPAS